MSKITLEPNDSGAGTFSIVSPDSNTNRTLTLPDEAGKILSTGNNDPAEVFKQSNILGTVSESGGVPTGAIIESGSNSNGEFVKYADGTMTCWVKGTLATESGPFASSTRLSGIFSYPAEFVDGSKIVAQLNLPVHQSENFIGCDRRDIVSWGTRDSLLTTGGRCSVFFTGGVDTSDARIEFMQLTVIGRWY